MPKVYHTFFADYQGETAEDILRAVHAEAAKEVPSIFEDWWKHQQAIWQIKYLRTIPDPTVSGAADKLLKILVDAGALEIGALKPVTKTFQDVTPKLAR